MTKRDNIFKLDNQNLKMQELKTEIKRNRDKNMHVKYMVIYNHLKGESNINIAMIFNICAHTVGAYINKYKNFGLSALLPAPKSGAPKRLTKEQEEKLTQVVAYDTPDNVGFPNKKNWNASLVMQWVNNTFGIKYSHSGMLKVLHRLNLSFTRPTYTLAKADPEKQEEFKSSFEVLKKPS